MKTSKEIEALRQFFPFTTIYTEERKRKRSVKNKKRNNFSETRNGVFLKQTYAYFCSSEWRQKEVT
jgi:hypothetical protein